MKEPVQQLLASFQELLTTADLRVKALPGSLEPAKVDPEKIVGLFERIYGLSCPTSFAPGLLLPEMVSVSWQYDENVSGEVQISNLITSMSRTLDASLLHWTLAGHRLADMRIADAVTDMAGPLHTLFEVTAAGIGEDLFLFDSRELYRLELSYADYLSQAAVSRGIIYWQYLFCADRVTLPMAQVLATELDFLAQRFPGPAMQDLQQRLRERSD